MQYADNSTSPVPWVDYTVGWRDPRRDLITEATISVLMKLYAFGQKNHFFTTHTVVNTKGILARSPFAMFCHHYKPRLCCMRPGMWAEQK